MRKEYDFSKGKRGAVIPDLENAVVQGKVRITTYLDSDVLDSLKARGTAEGKGYQTVLNELLRKSIAEPPLTEEIRQIIREELKRAA